MVPLAHGGGKEGITMSVNVPLTTGIGCPITLGSLSLRKILSHVSRLVVMETSPLP